MPVVTRQRQGRKKKAARRKVRKTASSSVLDRITPLEDVPYHGIKLCVYGRSGTGKTRFLSTFAKLGKTLHIVCSGTPLSEVESIRGTKNVDVVNIEQPQDLPDLIEHARDTGFVTVTLDHVTNFCDVVLADIIGIDKIPEQGSWGMAKRDDYAAMGLQVKTYLRQLLDLECNVLIAGQERVFNAPEDGGSEVMEPYVSVAATPSVAGWIAPAVDYQCQTFKRMGFKTVTKKVGKKTVRKREPTGVVEYCLRVGPDERYITKFRTPPGVELPDVVINPTYDKIKHLVGRE